jgi:hypothetical protein
MISKGNIKIKGTKHVLTLLRILTRMVHYSTTKKKLKIENPSVIKQKNFFSVDISIIIPAK